VSARLVGIGLLSIVCVAAAAAGGYLAMKEDSPLPAEVQVAPAAAPLTDVQVAQQVPADPTPAPPAQPIESRPVQETQIRMLVNSSGQPVKNTAPVPQTVAEAAQATPVPAATPVTTAPAPPPAIEPPAATPSPTPVATDPPRYVPDSPVQTAATTPETPRLEFEELTVARHSVIGIRLDNAISTRTARVEDRVSATVSRDVTVGGRTAIAAGVRLEGTVVLVERGGRFRTRPRLGLEFDRMVLADGTRVNIKTDTIYREGDSPSADATAKVGAGAVAGAILGAVIGGKKGAAIGGAAGATGGAAAVMRGDPNESSLPSGAPLTVRLTEDVVVTVNRASILWLCPVP
jgi:hypothetical protein